MTLLNGTVADANEVEAIFLPLYIDIAPINVDVPNKLGTGRFVLESALTDATAPVGTIIAFYDFGIDPPLFDPTIWNYCDGLVINSPGSPIDGQTRPDLSGRYICGFGADGNGDIGTVPFDAAPVGNMSSTLNLQHSHTVNAHNHTLANHTHGPGSLEFNVAEFKSAGGVMEMRQNNGAITVTPQFAALVTVNADLELLGTSWSGGENVYTTWNGIGQTDAAGGNTGNTAPGTNNQLTSPQDIRPRSIRVRFIMKVI